MTGESIASVYAGILAETINNESELNRIQCELKYFSDQIRENMEMMIYLNSPHISRESKKLFVQKIFAGSLSSTVINFINLLIDNDIQSSIIQIYSIIDSYRAVEKWQYA